MKKTGLVLAWVLGIALYLNTGFAFTNYFDKHVMCPSERDGSVLEGILSGPKAVIVSKDCQKSDRAVHIAVMVFFSILWPTALVFIAVLWFLYGFFFAVWLIFAGGIVKLLGLA